MERSIRPLTTTEEETAIRTLYRMINDPIFSNKMLKLQETQAIDSKPRIAHTLDNHLLIEVLLAIPLGLIIYLLSLAYPIVQDSISNMLDEGNGVKDQPSLPYQTTLDRKVNQALVDPSNTNPPAP